MEKNIPYRKNSVLGGAAAAAVLAAGFIALRFVDPVQAKIFPKCVFHSLTGLNCPGCGTARALHAYANGHVAAAFGFNAMVMAGLHVAAALWVAGLLSPKLREGVVGFLSDRRTLIAVFAIVVIFTVLRNLPVMPFRLLAP